MMATIRKPADEEYPAIFHLLNRAFAPSISEAELIRNLRSRGKFFSDFVIEYNNRVAAYICYTIAYDENRAKIGYHLAPLAVFPGKQRQGLGGLIVRESLQIMGTDNPVYVLGDPDYYTRFGFRKDRTQKCLFDPEGSHFTALSRGPLPPRVVLYEDEFTI